MPLWGYAGSFAVSGQMASHDSISKGYRDMQDVSGLGAPLNAACLPYVAYPVPLQVISLCPLKGICSFPASLSCTNCNPELRLQPSDVQALTPS